LALLGGPLLEKDYAVFDLVERAGGRVVLDASEGGLRTLPAAFDPRRVGEAPLEELADAYFRAIPDIFRRPNDGLYRWFAEQLTACQVRGILLRRYVWCDLWHAELQRLREWSPVPVLDTDLNYDDHSALARTLSRVEAFLETLP
jgi:benzoyl-CoA reductase/2-hydroxyglutaryl-CoA dehydratase subunit BcrC/BadD/HgdB